MLQPVAAAELFQGRLMLLSNENFRRLVRVLNQRTDMKKQITRLMLAIILGLTPLAFTACQDEPMEDLGEDIEQAGEETGEAIEDTVD